MARLTNTVSPVLDGETVQLGDGVARNRALRIGSGAYATPFWIRTAGGLFVRVDALPWQGVVRAGAIEVRSNETPPVTVSNQVYAEHRDAIINSRAVNAEQLKSVLQTLGVAGENVFGGAPPGEHPGEPDGMTQLADNDCSVVPGTGWGGSQTSRLFVVGGAIRHYFPAGTVPSGSTLHGSPHFLNGVNHRYVYTHFKEFEVSDPYQQHNNTITKLFFMRSLDKGTNHFWGMQSPAGDVTGTLKWLLQTQFPNGAGNENIRHDTAGNEVSNGAAAMSVGTKYDVAIMLVGSTTASAPHDGEVHLWIAPTGQTLVKKIQFTSVRLFPTSGDGKQDSFHWEYFWGGLGGTLNQDQYFQIGNVYVSGKS